MITKNNYQFLITVFIFLHSSSTNGKMFVVERKYCPIGFWYELLILNIRQFVFKYLQ